MLISFSSDMPFKLELISKPNLAANAISENLQKPQEEQKVVSHLENGQFVYIIKLSLAPQEHSFVFNNHPGHNMVLMKEDKTDLCEDACIKFVFQFSSHSMSVL